MSDRILTSCPNCQHELRVRLEYIGRVIQCNYCHQPFLAQSPGTMVTTTAAAQPAGAPHEEEPQRPSGTTEAQLEWAKGKIARLRAQRQAFAKELLQAKNDLGPLQIRATDLQNQLDQAHGQVQHLQEDLRAREVAQAELERLRAEAATLGTRAAEAVRLEEQLRQADDENRRLQAELEAGASLTEPDDLLQARCDRLENELESLRAAQDTVREAEGRLTGERDAAIRDRDRLVEELDSLKTGFKAAREELNRMGQGLEQIAAESARLEEERQAVSRMRDELQSLIGVRERLLSEREAELNEDRRRLDSQRSALETQPGPGQAAFAADLAEAEAQVAALRDERDRSIRELEEVQALWTAEADRNAESSRRLEAEIIRLDTERAELTRRVESASEEAERRFESARSELEAMRGEQETAHKTIEGHRAERDRLSQAEQRQAEEIVRLAGELAEATRQLELKGRQIADLNGRLKSLQDEDRRVHSAAAGPAEIPPRPQAGPEDDPAAFRADLEAWLERAGEGLAATTARFEWLSAEVKAARDTLELLHTDLALGDWDEEELAFPFEEG